jgi:cell division protein FtsB
MDMEELFSDNKLGQLEERIDNLLDVYRGMKEDKESLSGRVESLEAQNRELKEQMARVETEKEVIMEKVKGILEKIEKIEV